MKKNLLFLFTVLLVGMTSCKNDTNNPQAALSGFFDAMAKKDIATARKYCTAESKSMLDMVEMGMKMDSSKTESNKYDKNSVEFGQPKIEGDKAIINVTPKSGGESLNFYLKKENEQWKVAFDKNSMIDMGMEKMKEKGINNENAGDKTLDAMKNVNMDSIKKDLQNSLMKLDSVKRLLKKP